MRLELGIITIVEDVLGAPAERRTRFDWLVNKPQPTHFKETYPAIMRLFDEMGGDRSGLLTKTEGPLTPDAYFPEPYHCLFEFDELQHFTSFRAQTLRGYPAHIPLGFDLRLYLQFCAEKLTVALQKGGDSFRRKTADFPFVNGRGAQRAFFDTFRDWLPPLHGLRPTVRIAEFEVAEILNGTLTGAAARCHIRELLKRRVEHVT